MPSLEGASLPSSRPQASPIADFVAADVEAPKRRRRNTFQLPHVLTQDIDEAIGEEVLCKNQFPERTQRI